MADLYVQINKKFCQLQETSFLVKYIGSGMPFYNEQN